MSKEKGDNSYQSFDRSDFPTNSAMGKIRQAESHLARKDGPCVVHE